MKRAVPVSGFFAMAGYIRQPERWRCVLNFDADAATSGKEKNELRTYVQE